MSSKRILVVDDEPGIAKTLGYILQQQGFTTTSVVSISEARKAIENTTFSAIVLDVGLPDGTGFDFCKELRQKNNETPILFLTARKEEVDQVVGLEIGGDDYVTKPYKSRVVAAKLKAIINNNSVFSALKAIKTNGLLLIIFFIKKYSRKIHVLDDYSFDILGCLPSIFTVIGIEAISTDIMNFRHYWILLILLVSTFQNLKSTSSKSLNL